MSRKKPTDLRNPLDDGEPIPERAAADYYYASAAAGWRAQLSGGALNTGAAAGAAALSANNTASNRNTTIGGRPASWRKTLPPRGRIGSRLLAKHITRLLIRVGRPRPKDRGATKQARHDMKLTARRGEGGAR
jgi:hypothetical protein